MKASEIIARLSDLIDEHGDLEVTVADGHLCNFYRTNKEYPKYDIVHYQHNGISFIDIGIGGTRQEEN
jgi:hypothetical protein